MSPVAVVGIRIWCDLDVTSPISTPSRAPAPDPAAMPGLAPPPTSSPDGYLDERSGLAVRVHELAELSDGREITLLDDRGWGTSRGAATSDELLAELTIEEIERMAYLVLLPDWADDDHPLPPDLAAVEDSGGAQDWDFLAERLRAFGVVATPAGLMRVPRRFDLGEHLRARLSGAGG
ncbi:hypothetical protein MXD63_03095 [Frankia sp. Cpl3]|nr:hypothetical protein [Parafrankia colletiae]MCK9899066.1 hypothetical protein [Frankia sp. Cpl3]